MDLGLKNKVAIVTGGSQGIGRASALRLATEGAGVVIAARGRELLDQVASEIRAWTAALRRCCKRRIFRLRKFKEEQHDQCF